MYVWCETDKIDESQADHLVQAFKWASQIQDSTASIAQQIPSSANSMWNLEYADPSSGELTPTLQASAVTIQQSVL